MIRLQDIKVGDTIIIGQYSEILFGILETHVDIANIGKIRLKVMEITPEDKYNVGVHVWDEEKEAFVLSISGVHGCFWFIFENYQDTIRVVDEPKPRYIKAVESLDFNEKIL